MLYWKSQHFLVGIDTIDRQHQKLFDEINRFHSAMMDGPEKTNLAEMLSFLRSYADNHFRDEEELMTRYLYPGLNEQQMEHEHFRKDLDRFEELLRDEGSNMKTLLTVYARLSNWIAEHVSELDRKMGEFVVGKRNSD